MSRKKGRPWVELPFERGLAHIHLAMLTTGRQLAIVIGAGISLESGVPSGDKLLETMYGALWWIGEKKHTTLEQYLDYVLNSLPFNSEKMISNILSNAGIPSITDVTRIPSIGHMCVSRLIQGGITNFVMLLNFDELLERCIEAELGECGKDWYCIDDKKGFEKMDETILEAKNQNKCVVIKPHGTISKKNLLAAASTVETFHRNVERQFIKLLKNESADVIFIGCSLRDSDFENLFKKIDEVKATITIFDTKPVETWLNISKESLGLSQHYFETRKFYNTKIVYVYCNCNKIKDTSSDVKKIRYKIVRSTVINRFIQKLTKNAPTCNHIYVREESSPSQALLKIMEAANNSVGFLQKINAPWVLDLKIHDWIRNRLPGKRPGPEAFLTTEILIGAAYENGLFTRKRIVETRGYLELVDRNENFSPIIDKIFDRLSKQSDAKLPSLLLKQETEYALRQLQGKGIKDRIADMFGLNIVDVGKLIDLLIEIAERKAMRSAWRTRNAEDLVTLEQGTQLVVDTTNSLFIISEYGTWMRRERFVNGVRQVIERGKKIGLCSQVILASPPPIESQGYLEWLTSALWLKRQGVELYILDYKQHNNHVNLGDQVAIDFKRDGTNPMLLDSGVRFALEDRNRLRKIFNSYKNSNECESFDEWQFHTGLSARFGQVLIHNLFRCPLEQVILIRDRNLDKDVDKTSREFALEVSNRRVESNRPPLQDNLLFRPGSLIWENGLLKIRTGITSYFLTVGAAKQIYGWQENEITGMGISIIPYCYEDKQILIGKRSSQVHTGVGKFHVVGGHAHPSSKDFNQEKLSDACYQKLDEEMLITQEDVEKLEFLGLTLNLHISKPESIVLATLKQKSEVYINRWRLRGGTEEFDSVTTVQELCGVENDRNKQFLTEHFLAKRNEFTNAAQAAIICYMLSEPTYSIEPIERAFT